ncbi:hypothetical protein D3C86_1341470 [compost metagenome]
MIDPVERPLPRLLPEQVQAARHLGETPAQALAGRHLVVADAEPRHPDGGERVQGLGRRPVLEMTGELQVAVREEARVAVHQAAAAGQGDEHPAGFEDAVGLALVGRHGHQDPRALGGQGEGAVEGGRHGTRMKGQGPVVGVHQDQGEGGRGDRPAPQGRGAVPRHEPAQADGREHRKAEGDHQAEPGRDADGAEARHQVEQGRVGQGQEGDRSAHLEGRPQAQEPGDGPCEGHGAGLLRELLAAPAEGPAQGPGGEREGDEAGEEVLLVGVERHDRREPPAVGNALGPGAQIAEEIRAERGPVPQGAAHAPGAAEAQVGP